MRPKLILSVLVGSFIVGCITAVGYSIDSEYDNQRVEAKKLVRELSLSLRRGNRKYPDKYDAMFIKHSKHFFGVGFQVEWFKAQAIAESALNPSARSPVGAYGIMQIMPRTGDDIKRQQTWILNTKDPDYNIAAGIYYDRTLHKQLKAYRSIEDKMALVFAGYNGGFGNVLKAQKICMNGGGLDCNLWSGVLRSAPHVNTWKCEESIAYVRRIRGLYLTINRL